MGESQQTTTEVLLNSPLEVCIDSDFSEMSCKLLPSQKFLFYAYILVYVCVQQGVITS